MPVRFLSGGCMVMCDNKKCVLCGANAYEKKYYFNPRFGALPQSIKDELRIICVLFTKEAGGIFTIVFNETGDVLFEVRAKENDLLYDDIGSGLLINEIIRKKQELLTALSLYYKTVQKKSAEE